MKALEIAGLIEKTAPLTSAIDGDDLGFACGNPENLVKKIVTCWSPTRRVLLESENLGAGLVIAHEPLYYRRRWSGDGEIGSRWFEESEDEFKKVNIGRREIVERAGTCVYRAHSNWDIAPAIGIRDALATALGLRKMTCDDRFTAVYETPPVTVGALARLVRRRLGTGPIRLTGSPGRVVRRVGLFYGGLGQMFNSPEAMTRLGAEAAISGECLAYTLHHAREIGLSVIEAGHCASENPGIRAMAGWLARETGLPVTFSDSGRPWTWA